MSQALPFAASQAAIEYATEKIPLGHLLGDLKAGAPLASGAERGLLAMNHEATTDEKLSSHFLHVAGGTQSLPRPAAGARPGPYRPARPNCRD